MSPPNTCEASASIERKKIVVSLPRVLLINVVVVPRILQWSDGSLLKLMCRFDILACNVSPFVAASGLASPPEEIHHPPGGPAASRVIVSL